MWMRLAVPAVAVAIALGLGEGLLRAVVRLPLQRILPEVRYQSHPVRQFTLLPDQDVFSYGAPARIDHRGFRVSHSTPAPGPGTPTILALGDSFTFGLGVRDAETWPSQLQQRLVASGTTAAAVVNAGTISYGVFQERDLLVSEGLDLAPRVVVHALYWNDFMNAGPPAADAGAVLDENGYLVWDGLGRSRGRAGAVASAAVSSSALLFTAKRMLGVMRAPPPLSSYGSAYATFIDHGLTPEQWHTLEGFYRDLQRLAADHHFTPFVLVMPVSGIIQRGGTARDHPYPVEARRMLRRLGIAYVDGFELWADKGYGLERFLPEPVDAHLNAAGYGAVADALTEALLSHADIRARLTAR
jgi:lysophospholipase L1-like esterase